MALELVTLSASDATGATNTAAIKAALLNANTGIQLPAGTYNVRSLSGVVAPMPANKEIAGASVALGDEPVTTLVLVGSDSNTCQVITNASSGIATGITVRNLTIDGGRGGAWVTAAMQGACVVLSGQNDYSGTPHNVQVINCRLYNGVSQQTQFNSVNGLTVSYTKTRADSATILTGGAHGGDHDAVANEKPTKNVTYTLCDLDAYGQECIKLENCTDVLFDLTTFRQYVSLVQDQVDCYSSLERVTFRRSTFDATVNLSFLKRRRIPGSAYTNLFPSTKTCTLSGSNTVGGSLTSPGSLGGGGEYVFVAGDVGQMVGYYSGQGTGALIINSIDGNGGIATSTVVDVFSALTLPAGTNKWVIAGTNNGGSGEVTWDRCTFTKNGCIFPQDPSSANYGTQTVSDTVFSLEGNSWKYPAGVTVQGTGNLFTGLPLKRFAKPSIIAKYGVYGGVGITGVNEYMSRWTNKTSGVAADINAVIAVANNGDEVWALNGTYVASGAVNRDINLGGKTITLRAETKFGAWVDVTGGSGWTALKPTADVAGSRVWGMVFYGGGQGGGNGSCVTVATGDCYLYSCALIKGKTANSGPGARITTTGTVLMEDCLIAACDATTTQAALYISQAAPVGTITIRRTRVINNNGDATVAGVRIDNANTTIEGLEVVGNTSSAGVGGIAITKNCSIVNLTAAGNVGGGAAHDVSITSGTTTGDSWVCWSDNASAVKAVNVATSTLTLDKATLFGGSGNVTGAGTKNLTNIISTDPLFADSVGGNYQLKSTSPSRGVGVQRAGMYDAFNRPFAYSAGTANHGAWA